MFSLSRFCSHLKRILSNRRIFNAAVILFTLTAGINARGELPRQINPPAEQFAKAWSDGIPMQFEANAGQTDNQVKFLSRGPGYTLFLTSTQAVLSLSANQKAEKSSRNSRNSHGEHAPKTQTQLQMTL